MENEKLREIFREHKQSKGLNQSDFCQKYKVNSGNFNKWSQGKRASPASAYAVQRYLRELDGEETAGYDEAVKMGMLVDMHALEREMEMRAKARELKYIVYVNANFVSRLDSLLELLAPEDKTILVIYFVSLGQKRLPLDPLKCFGWLRITSPLTTCKDALDNTICYHMVRNHCILREKGSENVSFIIVSPDGPMNEILEQIRIRHRECWWIDGNTLTPGTAIAMLQGQNMNVIQERPTYLHCFYGYKLINTRLNVLQHVKLDKKPKYPEGLFYVANRLYLSGDIAPCELYVNDGMFWMNSGRHLGMKKELPRVDETRDVLLAAWKELCDGIYRPDPTPVTSFKVLIYDGSDVPREVVVDRNWLGLGKVQNAMLTLMRKELLMVDAVHIDEGLFWLENTKNEETGDSAKISDATHELITKMQKQIT